MYELNLLNLKSSKNKFVKYINMRTRILLPILIYKLSNIINMYYVLIIVITANVKKRQSRKRSPIRPSRGAAVTGLPSSARNSVENIAEEVNADTHIKTVNVFLKNYILYL